MRRSGARHSSVPSESGSSRSRHERRRRRPRTRRTRRAWRRPPPHRRPCSRASSRAPGGASPPSAGWPRAGPLPRSAGRYGRSTAYPGRSSGRTSGTEAGAPRATSGPPSRARLVFGRRRRSARRARADRRTSVGRGGGSERADRRRSGHSRGAQRGECLSRSRLPAGASASVRGWPARPARDRAPAGVCRPAPRPGTRRGTVVRGHGRALRTATGRTPPHSPAARSLA